jgi:hypothetical protein
VEDVYSFVGVDDGFAPDFDRPSPHQLLPASRFVERLLTNRTVGSSSSPKHLPRSPPGGRENRLSPLPHSDALEV